MMLGLSSVRSIVCIGAHPDDIEIGCGGTLLSLLESNRQLAVHWIIFACDAKRKKEAVDAFQVWSGGSSHCSIQTFEFRDTLFPSQLSDIKISLHAIAERLNPDLIFTHRREDLHQDHRVLSEVTWNTFRNHLILEYEIPKYEGDLGNPNVFVPLSKEISERKTKLLMELFASQQAKPWYTPQVFNGLMAIRGMECKSNSGMAEAFHGRKIFLSP